MELEHCTRIVNKSVLASTDSTETLKRSTSALVPVTQANNNKQMTTATSKKHARLTTNSELSNADLVVTQIQLKPKGTRPVKVPTEMIVVATKAPNA